MAKFLEFVLEKQEYAIPVDNVRKEMSWILNSLCWTIESAQAVKRFVYINKRFHASRASLLK